MSLIKDIQDKNFVAVKDYVGERVATIVADKITQKKNDFLAKARGMFEKVEVPAKDEDGEKPDEDKDSESKEKENPFAKKEDKDKKPDNKEEKSK